MTAPGAGLHPPPKRRRRRASDVRAKVRPRRNQPGFVQLSCWISEGTMAKLVAFADARETKQRLIVDAAIARYLDSAEREESVAAAPPPPVAAEATHGQ